MLNKPAVPGSVVEGTVKPGDPLFDSTVGDITKGCVVLTGVGEITASSVVSTRVKCSVDCCLLLFLSTMSGVELLCALKTRFSTITCLSVGETGAIVKEGLSLLEPGLVAYCVVRSLLVPF